jgi:hypothetical protein
MFRRIAVGIVATMIPILGIVAATPAAAAPASKHRSPTHCTAIYFRLGGSEGISVNCTNAPDDFQVIAVCASFLSPPWRAYGTVGENAPGHSIAVCHGGFPFGARVVDYYVEDVSD